MWRKKFKIIGGVALAAGVAGGSVLIAVPKIIELRNLRVSGIDLC